MKKALSIILVLMLLLSFAACEKAENGLKDITLCLDWTPNTNHTGFYVALNKGYYEKAGLKVKIVQPAENSAALMCASGQAQFAIDAQDTLAAALSSDTPLEVSAVAAILQHNTSGLIFRKGEAQNGAKSLENKTYSTWNNPIEQAMVKHIVEKDGGDFSKVKLISDVFTDEGAALKNKNTDSVWIFYGWGGINAELSGLSFDYISFKEQEDVFDYYTPVIIANNDFLETDEKTARAFLSATKKGYEYAVENPEESAQILIDSDDTGSLKGSEKLVTESQKWISKQYIADAQSFGVIDSERWDNFYNWLYENKLIDKKLPKEAGLKGGLIE